MKGWTYPGYPSLSWEEIRRDWGDAGPLFDIQCSHLAEGAGVRFVAVRTYSLDSARQFVLRVSVPMSPPVTPNHGIAWVPEVGVWRRCVRGVSSHPRRLPDATSVRRATPSAIWAIDPDGVAHLEKWR